MKRTAKKFCLNRETLLNLSSQELQGAEGGALTPGCGVIKTIYVSCGCVTQVIANCLPVTGFDCTKFC